MRKYVLGLLGSLALSKAASTERYIIQYETAVWENLHLNSLADNTVYILNHLQMTVADLSTDEISMYSSVPGINIIKDSEVWMLGGGNTQENPPSWGLDRIDQHDLPLDKKFHYGTDGEGVDVYVVDTGVNPNHVEFEGRAVFEKNFANDRKDEDCQGHGTHVSSTIAGKTVGVAKKAKIHGVKVLNCEGSGSNAGVLAGINYVVGEHKKNPNQKSVINMSLGGGKSRPLNAAVAAATKAGVTVVVAAGNEKKDACKGSPSSAPTAITVAASDVNDQSAVFTNFGKCVDVYAPGVGIRGAWLPGNDQYRDLQGTSMASPHVAGVAALILASGQAKTPAEVKAKLTEVATKNAIKGVPTRNTPNKLLFADPTWTSN